MFIKRKKYNFNYKHRLTVQIHNPGVEGSSPSFPPNKTPRSMIGAFSFVGDHQQQALDETANHIDNDSLMASSIPLTIS
jgi:hypothetical protein